MHVHTIYTRPLSVQVHYSRSCPIISNFCYNSSLVTWTVVWLTAAKFRPLIFPASRLALSNVANISIFMILYGFCLLPTQFWLCPLLITSRHGPDTKRSSSIVVSIISIIKNLLPSNGNMFTEPLSRRVCCLQSQHLATGLYATIYSIFHISHCITDLLKLNKQPTLGLIVSIYPLTMPCWTLESRKWQCTRLPTEAISSSWTRFHHPRNKEVT
jgi:hypothetical protein